MRTWSLVAVVLLAVATGADAQMHHRLKGSIRTTANVPLANVTIRATPANEHPMLKVAADRIAEGKNDEGMQALTVALGTDVPDETRVAAGEMALLVRNPALAKTIFNMVLQKQPKHPRAKLGTAGAALMGLEWEAAGKILWDARDLAPREQRPALAAAIDDLRLIARVQ